MELVCKLCNGMTEISKNCHHCCSKMEDGGKLSDYYDSYSPYESRDTILGSGMSELENGQCLHLFVCPNCGSDTKVYYNLVLI
ncbi:conserved hypothetical protein [Desulfofarcimen acetoxidans DSM 771]|uniref:Uncharacterized protein n=1 Tax=Desulfofarcimen acetoxidans (strain ATCC 49208 / DSM 771 / KCTC 5769 / VKM B-1644 / 5575) TaxID=485916 RepID=C8W5T8_DESAS|nr:hypothetical protein [Desulfofarcimen acetoxidans]ACV64088.1 conserved hypothetical protein [Desulfofarcimen acetoxidans DSM 771]